MTITRVVLILTLTVSTASGKTWRGLVVAPENRCSPYDSKDYNYSQSRESKIVASISKVYVPTPGAALPIPVRQTLNTSWRGPRPTTADSVAPVIKQSDALHATCST